ncbi:UDP-xylose and UDP-N-acetylglucosamine transporter-like [Amphibalanus amphitrite]|uniref:UDP-xylose and UDP-N-acetylglucosamine transporter-like n=1 Tax=Amphibalanus amphitrite TaxID=1232801 RepID=UPI001C92B1EC|nr:UDP-xylose and UDP-N-acetylglucosamine transporter-like [Amphibalanus amphitrite]XP_043219752.1 UDP-xylose and UDP-N-acetylglucosamine transporter-like [Amphibalanus amphitrite]XP_043219753.1 UDP-xylose and UDP-N-acetylglucosamine transporter-like [Amphibalanus amphitrite]XP_043219754.1 UDP-xylose and UDP-N-acetylglucosamine transporter-like [Amphibalanus amphitrite]XP_043219755.1 UDP-xylose and UDP-N-acetylglucosamine transporter-like [Amphibalanus amphitrite]
MHPAVAMFLVMFGCWANVVTLEMMTTVHPGCGNLVTCSQFIVIAIHGFVFTMKCGTVASKIPYKAYFMMVGLYFAASVINNHALKYGIPMPLHMIFKAGSLVANLIMGMIVLGRYYPRHKTVSVVAITIGIILCTYASKSAPVPPPAAADSAPGTSTTADTTTSTTPSTPEHGAADMWYGVLLLVTALLLSARLGIFQEVLYRDYGRHSQQALFFTHVLPLPMFAMLSSDLLHHAALFSASEPVVAPLLPIAVPRLWLILLANVCTQYICISSVFHLTESCTSLTVTLVITLRKFISLIFSIWYFSNPFHREHWIGSLLVFAGTLVFTDPFKLLTPAPAPAAQKVKAKAQ